MAQPDDDARHLQLVEAERIADGLTKRVLDLERSLGVVHVLLREPDRKIPGSHNTLQVDLARWFVRRELRRYSTEGGGR